MILADRYSDSLVSSAYYRRVIGVLFAAVLAIFARP